MKAFLPLTLGAASALGAKSLWSCQLPFAGCAAGRWDSSLGGAPRESGSLLLSYVKTWGAADLECFGAADLHVSSAPRPSTDLLPAPGRVAETEAEAEADVGAGARPEPVMFWNGF